MRKLIVSEFITLDGVIQAPGGVDEDRDGGFAYGAWTMPYWHDDIGKTIRVRPEDGGRVPAGPADLRRRTPTRSSRCPRATSSATS